MKRDSPLVGKLAIGDFVLNLHHDYRPEFRHRHYACCTPARR